MLGTLEKCKHFLKLSSFKYLGLRYWSTEAVEKANNVALKPRRFGRKLPIQTTSSVDVDFVNNLFRGVFNKEIFKFPSVVPKEGLDSVFKHSFEIEEYLKNSVKADSEINKDLIKDLQKVETFGLTIPAKYNGLGYSITESIFILECAAFNWKVGQFVKNKNLGAYIITQFGTEEQKQKYLPRLASGESLVTVAFLENGPSVDASFFNANAIYDSQNKSFVLNANKKWVPHADVADLLIVLTKLTKLQSFDDLSSDFGLLILEKNTPGVSVQQLKSKSAKEYGLFEINLSNVTVSEENVIGNNQCGYTILKSGFTFGELGVAALCSSMLKKLIFSISTICWEKNLAEHKLVEYEHVQSNIAYLTAFVYALESLLYFVAGRLDLSDNKITIADSSLTKIFALEALKLGIDKYVQIIGTESIKSPGLLEEALKVLHYSTIFDENDLHLKLLVGVDGVMHAGKSLSTDVKHARKPDQYPLESLKVLYKTSFKKKKKLNLKMELHEALSTGADILEAAVENFEKVVSDSLFQYGNGLLNEEFLVTKLTDIVVYIFALTASLTRASNTFCNKENNSEDDIDMAHLFATLVEAEFHNLEESFVKTKVSSFFLKQVGKMTFSHKHYPAAHPLIRTY